MKNNNNETKSLKFDQKKEINAEHFEKILILNYFYAVGDNLNY